MDASTAKHLLIAVGANLPVSPQEHNDFPTSPAGTIRRAITWARNKGFLNIVLSNIYRTPAFPTGSGPDYANAAISAQWRGTADQALAALHEIEAMAGRERLTRWGARTLDLDLLACDSEILPDAATFAHWHDLPPAQQLQQSPPQLIVPHPRMQDRSFVLVPLADVAPDWRHPVLGRTTVQMRDARPAEERSSVRLWADPANDQA